MGDFEISTEEVRELGHRLRFVASEFENAGSLAEDYGEHVSHGDLAHELEQFADNWRHKRRKLMETLQQFAETARESAESVDGVEDELVSALGVD